MSLLKPATNQTAFLKLGVFGYQGSGKTFTSSRIAAGLCKFAKIKSPKVAIFDTEKSSDFLVDYFKEQGIELLVVKSRAFMDLIQAIREAEAAGVYVFIVDSVTHVWRELMTSYQKKKKIDELQMRDWGPIKEEWAQFTTLFINSKMHFISLGRAGDTFDMVQDERTGKKKMEKSGTKMKAEGEFGYESDILIEMERFEDQKTFREIHRCWVRKDRWDILDGKSFDDPSFNVFLPVVQKLNLGGDHLGVINSDSTEMFDSPDRSWYEQRKLKEIALETLKDTLTINDLDGRSDASKKNRIEVLKQVFGTSSQSAIEAKSLDDLIAGIKTIENMLGKSAVQKSPMAPAAGVQASEPAPVTPTAPAPLPKANEPEQDVMF